MDDLYGKKALKYKYKYLKLKKEMEGGMFGFRPMQPIQQMQQMQ
jgi:hypothetical protein